METIAMVSVRPSAFFEEESSDFPFTVGLGRLVGAAWVASVLLDGPDVLVGPIARAFGGHAEHE